MPGSRREVWTRVSDSDRRRVSFRAELQIVVACLLSSVAFFQPNTHFVCDPIIVVLFCSVRFDSVPTRFCLGTWHALLSSPLLVMWKSNLLALGPRLIALLNGGHSSTKPSRTGTPMSVFVNNTIHLI